MKNKTIRNCVAFYRRSGLQIFVKNDIISNDRKMNFNC